MAQDISLMGATYPAVPSVLLPKSGGGLAEFVDKAEVGLEYLGSIYSETISLADTDFATWTPSSTATAILPTAEVGTFTAESINLHDYFSRFIFEIIVNYEEGTSPAKGRLLRVIGENWQAMTKRPSNRSNLNTGNKNAVVSDSLYNGWIIDYYSSATARSIQYSPSYSLYPSNVAAVPSANTNSPIMTVKRPVINARTNNTYFSVAQAEMVDQANSTIKFKQEFYRSYTPFNRKFYYDNMIDVWQNGLQ